jgi:hypothetical protein
VEVARYGEIIGELEMFISVAKAVSHRLVGTTTKLAHESYADPVFTKLLCHAISLQKLSPQMRTDASTQLWDMSSACAVARCIVEAHDVLGYIALSDVSDEERSFRVLVWRLHDQQRRSRMLQSIQSRDPQADAIHARAHDLAKEAEAHPWFAKLGKGYQQQIRTGDVPSFLLSHRELNAANGVNHDYHVAATMMLSQYVHTLPMSVHQLMEFRAGTPEALHLCSMPIQYSLGFFARAISRMVEVFPHGDQEITASQLLAFDRWNAVVGNGVTTSSVQGD